MKYDFGSIEKKWQERWKKDPYFKTKDKNLLKQGVGSSVEGDASRGKYYCLDMFPYPSGSGLHIGHWKGYVFSDVYARVKWHEGYNVLHPMGFDAFGLPAENYAIKQGVHPKISTAQNVAKFREQFDALGAMYDWDKVLDTTDPSYYKWTQWIFIKMFEAGLAYEDHVPINWCTKCLTGLANEEVVGGACERCGSPVEQREIRQWMLRITKYAEQLLDGLGKLDWPERVKLMQKNWIGKSVGARVEFKIEDLDIVLPVFTTRSDTLYGATFMVMAPDHDLLEKIVTDEKRDEIKTYQDKVSRMTEIERTADHKEKTGVFTGRHAINPLSGEKMPIYTSSYVLKGYGTGIVMAVPAHDQRDFEFTQVFKDLSVKQVIKPVEDLEDLYDSEGRQTRAYGGDGPLINSGQFDGLNAKTEGLDKIVAYAESKGFAKKEICYRLHDWVFSRQRYWGEPIPLIHCEKCGVVPVPEKDLPVELPEVESYQPTGTGESPLAAIDWWVNTTCPSCGGSGKRETNTMPQWAGSSWYFLRYPTPDLADKPFDSEEIKYWMPVDLYVGGIEHAILHLLYARFYVKVLHDLGYLSFDEPFKELFNQGMICMYSEKDKRVEKMSKSKGNVVNPDDIVQEFGSDALRMYMLFIGPPDMDCVWKMDSIRGVKNFLNRLWDYLCNEKNIVDSKDVSVESKKRYHRFLKTYKTRMDSFKVNTAVAAVMEYLNDLNQKKLRLDKDMLKDFLTVISVMIPHFSSELLEKLLGEELKNCTWPSYDEALAAEEEVELIVQVNGKLRARIVAQKDASKETIEPEAISLVEKWLEGKNVVKTVFVPNRLINFVVR